MLEELVRELESRLVRDKANYQELRSGHLGPTAAAILASTEAKLQHARAQLRAVTPAGPDTYGH